MAKDPYNGQFINDDNIETVVRDILATLEKWKLRPLEKEIALNQAIKFLRQIDNNKSRQVRAADANGMIKQWLTKLNIPCD